MADRARASTQAHVRSEILCDDDGRPATYDPTLMDVLVIDVGGSHVKLLVSGSTEPRVFDSSPELTPQALVRRVKEQTSDWRYDGVTLGFPGAVGNHGPMAEPGNLGQGWVGFDFRKAFDGKPTLIVNDAAMQALGAYETGRMLFLGLGTGLGSAIVVDRVVVPLETGQPAVRFTRDALRTPWP